MQEKNISMEDAFQVWWFIFWRTILTILVITFILSIIVKFTKLNVGGIGNAITLIVSILAQVFYIKSAINRNYKNFRLSATITNSDK